MEGVLGNKVIFSNLVIYSLSTLTSCREISRGVGFAGKRFLFPPPPPPFILFLFFSSRSNNSTGNACYAGYYHLGAWNRLKSMKSMGMKLFRRDLLSKVIIATHFDVMTQT